MKNAVDDTRLTENELSGENGRFGKLLGYGFDQSAGRLDDIRSQVKLGIRGKAEFAGQFDIFL